ncbi:hypothetical protein FN846DRAFT_904381 [Sphaerosporella brunnea]|uniref:Ubiquitin-like domain-containing protein n=1 Tax=Sphaerosporella brunnea TaxID=1250544 RepID=A0A5J5F4Z5_9PEZI|nr:hypothetical protein FN846DRAFT_904381 [Sphaerosporella brunnea]
MPPKQKAAQGFIRITSHGPVPSKLSDLSLPVAAVKDWDTFVGLLRDEFFPGRESQDLLITLDGGKVLGRLWPLYLAMDNHFQVSCCQTRAITRSQSARKKALGLNDEGKVGAADEKEKEKEETPDKAPSSVSADEKEKEKEETPAKAPSSASADEKEKEKEETPAKAPSSVSAEVSDPEGPRRLYMQIFVRDLAGKYVTLFELEPYTTTDDFIKMALEKCGNPPAPERIRFIFSGKQLEPGRTLGHYSFQCGQSVIMCRSMHGGKPVITIYPTKDGSEVLVRLTLSVGFDFTYVNPPTVIPFRQSALKRGYVRTVEWEVTAAKSGRLRTSRGQEAAYLFWDAEHHARDKPINTCRPWQFMVRLDSFPDFIHKIMGMCGFPLKERQDFITFWGPQLLRTDAIAVRFLTPAEYSAAADMKVYAKSEAKIRIVRCFVLMSNISFIDARRSMFQPISEYAIAHYILEEKERPKIGEELCVFEWGGMIVP